jgi:hypothetical protein
VPTDHDDCRYEARGKSTYSLRSRVHRDLFPTENSKRDLFSRDYHERRPPPRRRTVAALSPHC